jgi:hypothetical protein
VSGTVATAHFLPQQQAMFVAEQLLGPGIYNIGWQFQFSGVNNNIFFDLDELIHAHPILRMTIGDPSEGDLDNATIFPANPVRRADCSSLDGIKALTCETIKPPYAFGSHPLARFALGSLGNETYVCIGAHHALLDQWSSRLLFQELMERYRAIVQGKAYSSRISDFHSSDDVGWQKESNGRVAFVDRFRGYMTFPRQHWAKLHSTNPIERLNGEIKRRTDVVGIFPNDDAIVRLVGALLLEQNDEWAVQRARYMTLETISQMSNDPLISLPAVAR